MDYSQNLYKLWQYLGVILTLSFVIFSRVNGDYWIHDEQYFVCEGETVTITMVRDGAVTAACGDADIEWVTGRNGNGDANLPTTAFNFALNDISATATIEGRTDNDAWEGMECYAFQIDEDTCVGNIDPELISVVEICIIDKTPWVYIEEAQYIIGERTDLDFRIRRGGFQQDNGAITVEVATTAGTATGGGTDYDTLNTQTFTLTQGLDYDEETVGITEDDIREDVETFTLCITDATADDHGVAIGTPSNNARGCATVFILDESAWYYIEEAQYVVGEEEGSLNIRIRRDGYADVAGMVDVTVTGVANGAGANDFEYNGAGTLTFAIDEYWKDISIDIDSDDIIEELEAFTVTIDNPVEGSIGRPNVATVYIVDETCVFWIEEAQYIAGERDGSITVRIRRSDYYRNDNADPKTVDLTFDAVTATNNVDYDTQGVTQAEFDVGDYFVDVVIDIMADEFCEDLESFTIEIDNDAASPDYDGCTVGFPNKATVYIIDQTAWFALEQSVYVVGEHCATLPVGVLRGGYVSEDTLTVSIAIASTEVTAEEGAALDYEDPGILTYTFTAMETYKSMDFSIKTDDVIENTEKFTITLSSEMNGELKSPSTATVYIFDETTYFYIEETQYIVPERAGTIDVRFKRGGWLSDATTATVSYTISAAGDTATAGAAAPTADYMNDDPLTVSFATGVHTVDRTFSIHEDINRESLEYFTVSLDTVTAGEGYILDPSPGPTSATVFIVDESAWFYFEEDQYWVREKDGTITVRVRRDGYIWEDTDDITLDLLYTDSAGNSGTATGGGDDYNDLTVNPITFTAAANEDYIDVTITITDDGVLEDLETIILTLDNPSPDTRLGEPLTTTIFIEDQSTWFYIQEQNYIIGERTTTLTTQVCRGGCLWDDNSDEVDITFDVPGTDAATGGGTDYAKTGPNGATAPDTITFAAGEQCVDVTFSITTDNIIEDLEFFTITLGNQNGGFLGEPMVSTVFIVDETAVFWIEEAQYISFEEEELVVTVHRSGYIDETDIVTLTATDGTGSSPAASATDYTMPGDPTITFDPLDTSGNSDPISLTGDADIEDTEHFTIALTLDGATTNTWGRVIDPDPSTVFIFDRTAYFWIEERQYIVDEGQTLDVTFHRGGYLGRTDTLTLLATDGRAMDTAASGDDYDPPQGADTTITFAPEAGTAMKAFAIDYDNIIEHWEDFEIEITVDAGSSGTGTLYSPSVSTVLIRDPIWYNFDCAEYTVWENQLSVDIKIKRESDVTLAGSVAITTSDGTTTADTDYVAITAMTVTFGAGISVKSVPLTIIPDNLVETQEILYVTLSDPFTGEALGVLHKAVVKIFDNDAYYSIEKAVYHLDQKESTLQLTLNIKRFGYTGDPGTVELSTSDGSASSGEDYTAQTNTLVEFAAGDVSQPVIIAITNDGIVEEEEWFEISLSNPTEGELGVTRCANVIIEDDDILIYFGEADYHVMEDIGEVTITVVRGAYTQELAQIQVKTVDLSAQGGVDYAEVTHTVEFGVGETTASFNVPITNDAVVEQTESFEIVFSITIGVQIGYPSTANVMIENEDVSYYLAKCSYSVAEYEKEITLTVIRVGFLGRPSSIEVTTDSDTANSGQDFTGIGSQTIFFSIDQPSASFDVIITDDGDYELTEQFYVSLTSNVVEELSVPSTATVVIISDDARCERGCENGGLCINPNECACPETFTGDVCEIDVNECELPNADVCTDATLTCRNTRGGYYCECINPNLQLVDGTCRGNTNTATEIFTGQFAFVEYQGALAVFINELLDPSSDAYGQWVAVVNPILQDVFAGTPGLISVAVTSFYQSSIGVNFQLIADAGLTSEQVSSTFYSRISDDYYLGSSTLKLVPDSIYIAGTSDSCSVNYCLNGGVCIPSDISSRYTCLCASGYSGQNCQVYNNPRERTLSAGAIAAIVVACMVAVLTILLVCLCCYYYSSFRNRQDTRFGKAPGRQTTILQDGGFPQQMQLSNDVLDLTNLQLNFEGGFLNDQFTFEGQEVPQVVY